MKRATHRVLCVAAAATLFAASGPPTLAQLRIPIPKFWGRQSASAKLSKGGPSFAATLELSNLTFKAFAQGDWPLFIDYELEQPGHVWLTIKVGKAAPFTYEFKGQSAGRHEETITLPANLARKTAVASYSIRAVRDNTPGAPLVPYTLHALAVGNAVGSSGLTRVLFSPREVRVAGGRAAASASYSFSTIRRFSGGARADIRLVSGGSARRVGSKSFEGTIAAGETINGAWDCKKSGRPSLGRHQLFVKAWFTLRDSGSWAVAHSEESVMISP